LGTTSKLLYKKKKKKKERRKVDGTTVLKSGRPGGSTQNPTDPGKPGRDPAELLEERMPQ
jgi:hypothetical protein